MQRVVRFAILTPGLVLFLGCLGMCGGPGEGTNPGECSDGADNDEDGDFDCDDEDCEGSPDCDGEVESDTDTDADADSDTDTDTAFTPTELAIDVVSYHYSSSEWFYSVDLDGWAERVTMDISQDTSSPWEEYHELLNVEYDPGGAWDLWEIELPIVGNWTDQEESVNTLFQGGHESTMVWRVEAEDGDGGYDCVVWSGNGADPGVLMESGCREISF